MFKRPSADTRPRGYATMPGAMPASYRRSTELSGGAVKFGALAQRQENRYLPTTDDAPFGASPLPAAADRHRQPCPEGRAASVFRLAPGRRESNRT